MSKYMLEEKKKSVFILNKLCFSDSKSKDETLKKFKEKSSREGKITAQNNNNKNYITF